MGAWKETRGAEAITGRDWNASQSFKLAEEFEWNVQIDAKGGWWGGGEDRIQCLVLSRFCCLFWAYNAKGAFIPETAAENDYSGHEAQHWPFWLGRRAWAATWRLSTMKSRFGSIWSAVQCALCLDWLGHYKRRIKHIFYMRCVKVCKSMMERGDYGHIFGSAILLSSGSSC